MTSALAIAGGAPSSPEFAVRRGRESLAEILGLEPPTSYGPFRVLTLANGVSLGFADDHGEPDGQHRAFMASDEEFDAIQQRIVDRGWTFWADPARRRDGEMNTNDGGRASTGRARTDTTWRSSPFPMAADGRGAGNEPGPGRRRAGQFALVR